MLGLDFARLEHNQAFARRAIFMTPNPQLLEILQFAACLFMTGLIWVIQLLHYPSFSFIAEDRFHKFHNFHSTRIMWIVGPVMLIEVISAGLLCWSFPQNRFWGWNMFGIVLIWLSTILLSIPRHNILASGDRTAIVGLVHTNWPRTILWSLRSVLLCSSWYASVTSSLTKR